MDTDRATTLVKEQPLVLEVVVTPEIAKWAESFLNAKRAESVSRKTIMAYGECLTKFLTWASNRSLDTVEQLTPVHIREFLLFLEQMGHNSGGVHRHYRCLKTFLRWYENEVEPDGWKNPIAKVKAPKLVEAPIDPVSLSDIESMVAACHDSRQGLRDRAILLTLLDTGLRANELLTLDLADLDQYSGEIRVRPLVGKGRKPRAVFLGERSRRAMRAYLKTRGHADGALFERESGGRLKYPGLRQIVRRCAVAAGLHEPPLHGFRRAFALSMLRNGCDLLTLQRLMGHSSMALLSRYAKQNSVDLRQVHTRTSPADHM